MHLEFLLEEASAEIALSLLLPKILPGNVTYRMHVFSGKANLKSVLPQRLKGYTWIPENYRLIVLIDRDSDDCKSLKQELELVALQSGLLSKTAAAPSPSFQIVNRIVIEELEVWFFGDIEALCSAYPGVPASLRSKQKYRNPDNIQGGTSESLFRALQKAGYFNGHKQLPKREAARAIAEQMIPERNDSPSFKLFSTTLRKMTGAD